MLLIEFKIDHPDNFSKINSFKFTLAYCFQDVTTANLKRASDGVSQFRQAFGRRTETYTDFGPARNHAAIVVHIGLIMVRRGKYKLYHPNNNSDNISIHYITNTSVTLF